jgi:DNA-binding transcriptional regulator YbjK
VSTTQAAPARSEQGAERRGAILEATVRLLVRDGLGAITHRAVAREAEVPLAATTYYFASKDELVTEALAILVEDEIGRIAQRAAALGDDISSPSRSAAAVAEVLFPDADSAAALLAKFEVYLEASRRPGLRATAAHWLRAFEQLAESSLELAGSSDAKRLAPLLVAGIDGLLVHRLSEGIDDLEVEHLREQLEELFALVLAAG